MKKIVIIGASIAGLNCALTLDAGKYKVTVIDKSINPGEKPCAGGVSAKCDAFIPERFYESDFDKIVLMLGKKQVEIDRRHRILHTIDREGYVNYLLNECKKKGIKVMLGCTAKDVDLSAKKIMADCIDCREIKYDILIGADGCMSLVRRKLGLKSRFIPVIEAKTQKKFNEMKVYADARIGYFWIFPHKEYTSIGCAMNKNIFNNYCTKLGIKYYDMKGTVMQYNYNGYKFGDVYLIGEAGGFMSKLTGEGIYHAIVSGIEVANEINGVKSEKLAAFIKKLSRQTYLRGALILLVFFVAVPFSFGEKIIRRICEWLSVK